MIKLLAVLGNVGILGMMGFVIYDDGFPEIGKDSFWALWAFTLTVTCNLIYIFMHPASGADENIIALWLKVKKANLKKQLKE